MSLQFILGASGSGKSHYIYNRIIKESIDNPDTNYIMLVPEQYSLALQRKMVMLHPRGGSMNIDVIGFNRLSYRLFDELSIRPANVLEDFGKTMLIRQVAGEVAESLKIYGKSLDKSGFIDEVKSLMSEMYQYDLSKENIKNVIELLGEEDSLLRDKLSDMLLIFQAFEERIKEEYIVAEELTELLCDCISKSQLIKKSVICLEGFTGFTPIQLKCIGELMVYAKKVYSVLTIDKIFYEKKNISEHELFYLTKETKDNLLKTAEKHRVCVDEDIFIENSALDRWHGNRVNEELAHLEKNIFRYPYTKYKDKAQNISITSYDNPRKEIMGVARRIKELVIKEGYRYKDIAVISGNLENIIGYVEQLLPDYDIPYFLDYSRPVKNNQYIDAISSLLRMVEDNFSYDSVFAFLKSGVVPDMPEEEIEVLENFCLARGIRGKNRWNMIWDEEVEEIRAYFIECVGVFCDALSKKNITVAQYVDTIKSFMDKLNFKENMEDVRLFEKILSLLDKMVEIMGNKTIDVGEFSELMDLGLKDISLGMIPGKLDMVTIGDITRTRLEDVKILFIIGVNDGIIPKKGTPAQIISDKEKERLSEYDFLLAPTEKMNSFIEQFYLYINMTKPSDKLFLSYTTMDLDNEVMRPSYIIGRVCNLYTDLKVICEDELEQFISTPKSGVESLIEGLLLLFAGDVSGMDKTLKLYKAYWDLGYMELLDRVFNALSYCNIPKNLDNQVAELLKLNLMSQSVSRLEQYANCAYAYFLKYTLKLRERDLKGIDNRNIGNILHSAMERLYRHVHDNMSNDWSMIDDDSRDAMMENFVNSAFYDEYAGQLIDEGRYAYLRNMLVRIGKRSAKVLSSLSKEDNFTPKFFEYNFNRKIALDETGKTMSLTGIVDRADILYDEEKQKINLRIIDYKSGNYDFNINRLYEGLQLQLSVYMNIMLELSEEYYNKKKETEPVEIIPDSMFYYQMKDPYVEVDKEEKAEEKRAKELKLKGYKEEDKTVFKNITDYAMYKSKALAKDILSGNIEKNPFRQGNKVACEYCEFKSVCRFDTKTGGNSYRYPKFKDKERDMIYDQIKNKLGGESHGMD